MRKKQNHAVQLRIQAVKPTQLLMWFNVHCLTRQFWERIKDEVRGKEITSEKKKLSRRKRKEWIFFLFLDGVRCCIKSCLAY